MFADWYFFLAGNVDIFYAPTKFTETGILQLILQEVFSFELLLEAGEFFFEAGEFPRIFLSRPAKFAVRRAIIEPLATASRIKNQTKTDYFQFLAVRLRVFEENWSQIVCNWKKDA